MTGKQAVAIIAALLLLSGTAAAQVSSEGRALGKRAKKVGKVTDVRGRAEIRRFGQVGGLNVEELMPVHQNDVLETGPRGRIKILFADDSVLTVGEETRLKVSRYAYRKKEKKRRSIFNLFKGRVRALVSRFIASRSNRFEIHTPTAVAGVRGTDLEVEFDELKNISRCFLFSGLAEWGNDTGRVRLNPGFFSVVRRGKGATKPAAFSSEQRRKRNRAMSVRSYAQTQVDTSKMPQLQNLGTIGLGGPRRSARKSRGPQGGLGRFLGGGGFNCPGCGVPDPDTYFRPGTIHVNVHFGER